MSKQAWRDKFAQHLTYKDYLLRSFRLSSNLKKITNEHEKMGCFYPIRPKEPLWYLDLKEKEYLFPIVNQEKGLEFFESNIFESETLQAPGAESFRYPAPRDLSNPGRPDVLLIPGLAFDHVGRRLGRGGGFYDRYLKNFNGLRIGVCFRLQVLNGVQVSNSVPTQRHDEKVDIIVTEHEIIDCRKGKS